MEAILQQALKMVVEEGFDGLSMQKLAKAAGVSPATIYIYFKDRDDLLLQLYQLEVDKYFDYVLDGFDPEWNFATGLSVQWKRRAQYIIDNPDKAHFMEHFSFTPLNEKAVVTHRSRFVDVMHRFITRAIENRELVKMPLEVYWSVAFAPLYNLVKWHKAGKNMAGQKFVLTDEMLEQTLALVLKALRP
ncbi:TetR/AcrR family transcriptional regulator [Puia sp. P3]|uniref:TetR/AcrR family transcriptional regulator n=1 Tax=Puia sp. P3 TaxID=3423952 RepID=UPI003D67C53C